MLKADAIAEITKAIAPQNSERAEQDPRSGPRSHAVFDTDVTRELLANALAGFLGTELRELPDEISIDHKQRLVEAVGKHFDQAAAYAKGLSVQIRNKVQSDRDACLQKIGTLVL